MKSDVFEILTVHGSAYRLEKSVKFLTMRVVPETNSPHHGLTITSFLTSLNAASELVNRYGTTAEKAVCVDVEPFNLLALDYMQLSSFLKQHLTDNPDDLDRGLVYEHRNQLGLDFIEHFKLKEATHKWIQLFLYKNHTNAQALDAIRKHTIGINPPGVVNAWIEDHY